MRIGALNKRITIQIPTKAPDGMGSFTITWTDHATVFCAIWPLMGKELVQAMQTDMVISHRIRIRYRSVFRPDWKLRFGQRYFNIVSVTNPGERNEWLDIMTREAV